MNLTEIKSSTDATQKLKYLIQILHDGQEGFRHASENVVDLQLKEIFSRFSLQRAAFAAELQSELIALGKSDPQKEGTTFTGAVHRRWIDLKAAFTKGDHYAVLVEAERGEDAAVKAYKDALTQSQLAASLRETLISQFVQVQAAHDEVKKLRDVAKLKR